MKDVNILIDALEKIKKTRYGLDFWATDEEAREHWSRQTIEYQNIARKAIKDYDKSKDFDTYDLDDTKEDYDLI